MTTIVDEAKATAAELADRIDGARAAIAAIDQRRSALAFDAHTGDAAAKKSIATLHAERNAKVAEIEDLEVALTESRRRIVIAEKTQASEAERLRAEKALPIAQRLAERGAALDAAMRSYCENFRAVQSDLDELSALGCPVPSRSLVAAVLRRQHEAALSDVDRIARPVPPLMRRSFDVLLKGWALPASNWITEKLNTAAQKAA